VIEQLRQVLAVREAHLLRMRARLAELQAALAAVDQEVALLDAELQQIADQRATWEREWQHWLHHDRVLRHGQDYSLTHMALSIWERDTRDLRAEVWQRREAAANDVDASRALLLTAQRKADALREKLREAERLRRAQLEAVLDSRAHDDATPHLRLAAASKG
jgi:hypothetical protein